MIKRTISSHITVSGMTSKLTLALKFALLSLAAPALAHETSTHAELTRIAVEQSVLVKTPLLTDLGLEVIDLSNSVVVGAIMEDDDYDWRAFNHFFDPQYNSSRGRGLSVLVVNGNPSPSWILEDLDHQSDYYDGSADCPYKRTLTPCPQQYSFRLGQQQLFRALTASTPDERDTAAALVFRDLGHVVHHIQDMAQPQHTRNDQHTHPLPITKSNPQWAFYEVYTAKNDGRIRDIVANNPYPKSVTFATARQFWSTSGVAGQYKGMADFTANNFTSYGAQYVGRAGDPNYIGAAPGFPLPNGSNRALKMFTIPAVIGTDGKTRSGSGNYIVGPVYDGYTGTSTELPLAATSIISDFVASKAPNATPVYIENALVFEARYKVLLPRAVAFSTGLINHFFRGLIDVSKSTTAETWVIKNSGSQDIDGVLCIMAEDSAGNRSLINDPFDRRTLKVGASISVSPKVPSGTKKLVFAFRGKIGEEGDPSGIDWFAVAGKVVDYVPTEPEIVVVGNSWKLGDDATVRAFRWSSRTGLKIFPVGAGGYTNEAWGVSPDGKFVVGSTTGLGSALGLSMADIGYYFNGIEAPTHEYAIYLTVASAWNTDVPNWAFITRYPNAGQNYSVAWSTNNGGTQIKGEARLPSGIMVSALWFSGGVSTYTQGTYKPNPLASADGSIMLVNNGGRAYYIKDKIRTLIPVPVGHNQNEAKHVVVVK